jgi:hypothetical protein
VFLGTPHHGSDVSMLGYTCAKFLRCLGSNPSLLAELHLDAAPLKHLHDDFVNSYGLDVHMVNFYERRRSRLAKLGTYQWEEFVSSAVVSLDLV